MGLRGVSCYVLVSCVRAAISLTAVWLTAWPLAFMASAMEWREASALFMDSMTRMDLLGEDAVAKEWQTPTL